MREYDTIRLWVYEENGDVRVYEEETPNCEVLEFTFWKMDYGMWDRIEQKCIVHVRDGRESSSHYDREKMVLEYLRLAFRGWNLDREMHFLPDGGLDDESMEALLSLHPRILEKFSNRVDEYVITDEDDEELARQSALLFGKVGSVSNPSYAISLYCTLCDFWSKFGLNYFDLQRMPLREKNLLKRVLHYENQVRAQEARQEEAERNSKAHFRR